MFVCLEIRGYQYNDEGSLVAAGGKITIDICLNLSAVCIC
jgi:hypothetical protein